MSLVLTWQCVENEVVTPEVLEMLKKDPSYFLLMMGRLYNEGKGGLFIDKDLAHPSLESVEANDKNIVDMIKEYEPEYKE